MQAIAVLLVVGVALSAFPAGSIAQSGLGGGASVYNSIERGRELERQRQRKLELERREDERYQLERRTRQRAADRGEVLPQPVAQPTSAGGAELPPAPLGSCLLDQTDTAFCAPPGGGIAKDSTGRVACGSGQCVAYGIGNVACSKVTGGGALLDSVGTPLCVGGCEDGRPYYCAVPRQR